MSKRCKLQKEYYRYYGNYKGICIYNLAYVRWLENEVLRIREILDRYTNNNNSTNNN